MKGDDFIVKQKNWNFLLRADENLHKELESLSAVYGCSLQDLISYLLKIGLIELQSKELYTKVNDVKKFMEEKLNINF